jgi:hypothetical protein
MLTHKPGDVGDLALAPSGNDYFVAWIDERNHDPELYATKVNHALTRIAPEQRLTQAPGAATDVSLLPTAQGALAVWADARESEQAGAADIYAVALHGNDVSRIGNELCVQKTRAHSFAPSARAYGPGALVAWLEAASDGAEGGPAHLSFAVLDPAGKVMGSVESVSVGAGTPLTLGLDCSTEHVCHAVVSVDEQAHGSLYAVTITDGKAGAAVRIRTSSNVPSSVAPRVHGNEVYVADVQQGRSRLRRLQLEW